MHSNARSNLLRSFHSTLGLLTCAGLTISAAAQTPSEPAPTQPTAEEAFVPQLDTDAASYVKRPMAELENLVAPVALYPDELLAQILPSSTSPLDVVKAHQYLFKNPDMVEPPEEAVWLWDPAVISLMQFRDVITMMAEDITWTTSLGEAVYFQEDEVYDAIQLVRSKANAKGMLADGGKQIVVEEEGIIRIEPSDPQIIYIPQYDPQVIYVDQPVVVYEPLLTYSTGVALGWGLTWAFDWNYHRCVPHHHWGYSWHHRRHHRHYGRSYHGGHKNWAYTSRHRSIRPPSGHPPRPSNWKPVGRRPKGWKPPYSSHYVAGRSGSDSRSGPGRGDVWKPARPIGRGHSSRTSSARTGAAGQGSLGRSRTTSSRAGARPGNLSARQASAQSSRAGSRPVTPSGEGDANRSGNRRAAPASQSSASTRRASSPTGSRAGSRPGSLRPTQPTSPSSRGRSSSSRGSSISNHRVSPPPSPSRSVTPSRTASSSRSRSATPSRSASSSRSRSATPSRTASPSRSRSATPSRSASSRSRSRSSSSSSARAPSRSSSTRATPSRSTRSSNSNRSSSSPRTSSRSSSRRSR